MWIVEGLVDLHGKFLRLGEGRQRAVKHVVKKVLPQLLLDIIPWFLIEIVLVKSGTPMQVCCGVALNGGVGRSKERRSIEPCKSGD